MKIKIREGKIPTSILIFATILSLILIKFELDTKRRTRGRFYDEKLQAAEISNKAQRIIKQKLFELNFPIDRINDPNETGMIGIQYSPLTSERGDLESKLTATNPNFAALIYDLFVKAGLKKGDRVAVSINGSYPALNISVMSAIKVFGLDPVIITAMTSSMWGANNPEYTYLDMERDLIGNGLLSYRTTAVTYGGDDDIGRGLSPEARDMIKTAALRNNVLLIEARDLGETIEQRMKIYQQCGAVKMFINVGEQASSITGTQVDEGLITGHKIKIGSSVIARLSSKGIPVINLIDINKTAVKNELPIAPIPLPQPGDGPLFSTYRYSVVQALISVFLLAGVLFLILRFDVAYYFRKKTNKEKI